MVVFHEIIGPILASVAVILTLFLFKKTIDFQAYRELDSDYMDVLKVGLDHPELRDIDHINKYPAFMDINDRGRYDTFAMTVWNMLETMYDRHKIDKTWYPVFESESKLHYKWLKKPESRKYFKNEFLEFIDICNNEVPPEVGRTTTEMQMRTKKEMRRRTTKRVVKIGAFGVIGIVGIVVTMLILPPEKLYDLQYFDRSVIIDCARNYRAYDLDRPSDCSEFSSGSLAELCAVDPEQFKKSDKSDCSVFITPGQINHEQTPPH